MTSIDHLESLYPLDSRKPELTELSQFLKGSISAQLVGAPGVGRGNMLGLLAYNRPLREQYFPDKDRYHFVYLDMSEVKHRPIQDALIYFFIQLRDTLGERKFAKEQALVNKLLSESLRYKEELVTLQGLKHALSALTHDKGVKVVFLFERFEKYLQVLAPAFFTYLHSLRAVAKHQFCCVFSVNRPLETLLDASILSDFSDFVAGHTIYLRLHDSPSTLFRIDYLSTLMHETIAPPLKKELIRLTGGHMRLTRTATEAILAQGSQKISSESLRDTLMSHPSIRSVLQEIWDFLLPEEQDCLKDTPITPVSFLEDIGLLKDGVHTIPLFEGFVPLKRDPEIKAYTYDEAKRSIFFGNANISDTLTRAEFHLLSYLITHPSIVIPRDEIISVVWKDTATTQGVTEQALDQLILRLRKKIETDPKQPQLLATIKGRGIQWNG